MSAGVVGAGEEEGPRLLAHVVDDHLLARDHAAHHAERLAQRADLHVEHAVQPEVVHDAAPAAAQHAFAVRVVHHRQHAVAVGHLGQLVQRRDVAVHAEDAVGDQQAAAVVGQVLLDLRFQRRPGRSARRRRSWRCSAGRRR